jgi:hypothetical protein
VLPLLAEESLVVAVEVEQRSRKSRYMTRISKMMKTTRKRRIRISLGAYADSHMGAAR